MNTESSLAEVINTTASIAYNSVSFYSQKELSQNPVRFFHELEPEKQKELEDAVIKIAKGEINTIAWLHENWCESMRKEGWEYASFYDPDNKGHPNLSMAAYVTPEERTKYFIFYYTVQGLLYYQNLYMNFPSEQNPVEQLELDLNEPETDNQ